MNTKTLPSKAKVATEEKKDLYQQVTDKLSTLLEGQLTGQYACPWIKLQDGLPRNPHTTTVYSGINVFLLSMSAFFEGYAYQKWLTYLQVKELGGYVRKGEGASSIIYSQPVFKNQAGNTIHPDLVRTLSSKEMDDQGIACAYHCIRSYAVFNVSQIEGLPEQFYHIQGLEHLSELQKDQRAEELILASGATISHQLINRAFYRPETDSIHLPLHKQFTGTEAFYKTSLHELAHWTGHKTRLARNLTGEFGSADYAFEELIAELTTAFVSAHLGFESQITSNAAYIASWLKALEDDKRYFFRAAAEAQKAANYILHSSSSE